MKGYLKEQLKNIKLISKMELTQTQNNFRQINKFADNRKKKNWVTFFVSVLICMRILQVLKFKIVRFIRTSSEFMDRSQNFKSDQVKNKWAQVKFDSNIIVTFIPGYIKNCYN